MRHSPILLVVALAACSGPTRPRAPMGALPSGTTSATPQWVPFGVLAGKSHAPDSRERHFAELRRLTFDGAAGAPTWDATATAMRFVSTKDCRTITTLNLASGVTEHETRAEVVADCDPSSSSAAPRSPSADGAWLAWSAPADGARDGTTQIWRANANGTRPHAITKDGRRNVHPTFTGDSRRIAYASDRDATAGSTALAIFVVDPDGPVTTSGGPRIDRVSWSDGSDLAPRFSHDGRWLAFLSSRAGQGFDVFVARWRD